MKKDAAVKAAILTALERQLKKGDKSVVGNKGYRRFLATRGDDHFAIDCAKAVCIRCEPQALSDFSWRRCSRGGRRELTILVPGPREQFVDLLRRMVRQAGMDVGELALRIDVI